MIFLVLLAFPLAMQAQETSGEWALDDCISYSLANNIQLKRSHLTRLNTKEDILQSKASLDALKLKKDDFQSSFKNPPLSYAPFVRWWWPGNDVETNELQREMNLFARHHIGGVEIQSCALVVPPPMERMAKIMSFDTDA